MKNFIILAAFAVTSFSVYACEDCPEETEKTKVQTSLVAQEEDVEQEAPVTEESYLGCEKCK